MIEIFFYLLSQFYFYVNYSPPPPPSHILVSNHFHADISITMPSPVSPAAPSQAYPKFLGCKQAGLLCLCVFRLCNVALFNRLFVWEIVFKFLIPHSGIFSCDSISVIIHQCWLESYFLTFRSLLICKNLPSPLATYSI